MFKSTFNVNVINLQILRCPFIELALFHSVHRLKYWVVIQDVRRHILSVQVCHFCELLISHFSGIYNFFKVAKLQLDLSGVVFVARLVMRLTVCFYMIHYVLLRLWQNFKIQLDAVICLVRLLSILKIVKLKLLSKQIKIKRNSRFVLLTYFYLQFIAYI